MSPEDSTRKGRRELTLHRTGQTPATQRDVSSGERIQVAPEVIAVLGAASVMRLRADLSLTEFICQFCEHPGDLSTDGGSLIALRYTNNVIAVRLAHPRCSLSTVVTLLRPLTPPCEHRVHAICWLQLEAAGDQDAMPVLVVSNHLRAWRRANARQGTDLYARSLTEIGFTIVRDMRRLHELPRIPGLMATIVSGPGVGSYARIRIEHPEGEVFGGEIDLPSGWAQAARTKATIAVLTATPAPTAAHASPDETKVAAFLVGLEHAAGRHQLLGALAHVVGIRA